MDGITETVMNEEFNVVANSYIMMDYNGASVGGISVDGKYCHILGIVLEKI